MVYAGQGLPGSSGMELHRRHRCAGCRRIGATCEEGRGDGSLSLCLWCGKDESQPRSRARGSNPEHQRLRLYENGGGCLPLFRSAGAWPHCRDLVDCRYPWAGTVAILLSYKSASKYLYRSAGATEPRTRNKHSVH